MRRNREDDEDVISTLDERGRVVVDLANALQEALIRDRQRRRISGQGGGGGQGGDGSQERDSDQEMESETDVETDTYVDEDSDQITSRAQERDSDEGAWRRPPPDANEMAMTQAQIEEILRDPASHFEFVMQNRRFKLIPIGTIEPVAKEILEGPNGGLYYMKKWDKFGNPLPWYQWTRVDLKKYQKQQCIAGHSSRSRGLAGFVQGQCLDQPKRRHASREPQELKKRRN